MDPFSIANHCTMNLLEYFTYISQRLTSYLSILIIHVGKSFIPFTLRGRLTSRPNSLISICSATCVELTFLDSLCTPSRLLVGGLSVMGGLDKDQGSWFLSGLFHCRWPALQLVPWHDRDQNFGFLVGCAEIFGCKYTGMSYLGAHI